MEKQVFSDPPPLRRYAPEIPPRLSSLVARMMRKKPQERPQTATRIIKELEEMLPLLRAEASGHKTWNENDPEARVTADAREEGEVHLDAPVGAPVRSGRRYRGRMSVWGSIGGFLLMLGLAAIVMVSTGYLAYRFASRKDAPPPPPEISATPEKTADVAPEKTGEAQKTAEPEAQSPPKTEAAENIKADDPAKPLKKEAPKKKRAP